MVTRRLQADPTNRNDLDQCGQNGARLVWKSMRVFIFLLLLSLPVCGLTQDEERLIKKMSKYYQSVGMKEKAQWLERQVKAGRVVFDRFTGDDAASSAWVHPRTKVITINENVLTNNNFRGLVVLGNTLSHERKHQEQSYLGWVCESHKESLGLGNAYEREGWAEAIRVARKVTMALRKKLGKAKSARDKAAAGRRLKAAAGAWRVLLDSWKSKSKSYGKFSPREFRDSDGLPLSLDDMAKEQAEAHEVALDAIVVGETLSQPYTGKYRGSLGGGAKGSFNFDILGTNKLRGVIRGSYYKGSFQGKVDGTVNQDGIVRGKVYGTVKMSFGKYNYTGDFSGSVTTSGGRGTWRAGQGKTWPSGTWSVRKL